MPRIKGLMEVNVVSTEVLDSTRDELLLPQMVMVSVNVTSLSVPENRNQLADLIRTILGH